MSRDAMVQSIDVTFLLGVSQRCGTNYLARTLWLHPDLHAPDPVCEDHLVHHLHHLTEYARTVEDSWAVSSDADGLSSDLLAELGAGICRFLVNRAPAGAHRVLTKCPTTIGLEHFARVFPHARLLLLVRDGRSVVESAVRSFDFSYEQATRRWARNADSALRFLRPVSGDAPPCTVVRYEALLANPRAELTRVLRELELDESRYDFDAALQMPIFGSSDLRHRDGVAVHWDPVPKSDDFRPLERWHSWSLDQLRAFDALAGGQLRALGYGD